MQRDEGTLDDSGKAFQLAEPNETIDDIEAPPPPTERIQTVPTNTVRARTNHREHVGNESFQRLRKKTPVNMDITTGKLGTKKGKETSFEIRKHSDCRPRSSRFRRHNIVWRLFNATKSLSGTNVRESDHEPATKDSTGSIRTGRDTGELIGIHGRLQVQSFHQLPKIIGDDDAISNEDNEAKTNAVQYRLQTRKKKNSPWRRVFMYIGISPGDSGFYDAGIYDDGVSDAGVKFCGLAPNYIVSTYLHWTFRRSFVAVLFSAVVGFFGLSIIFALFIFLAGVNHPECMYVAGKSFGETPGFWKMFGDAFQLSWTTFATVGYGATFPATSAVESHIRRCTGITILCTLESFVGILFGSLCGAVFHSKVSRVRSQAQVLFSDPMVLRYGSGVLEPDDDDDDDRSHRSGRTTQSNPAGDLLMRQIPCPLLEFRVVNRLHGTKGGEILNATMNIVASVDVDQSDEDILKRTRQRNQRKRKGKFVGVKRGQNSTASVSRRSEVAPTTIIESRPLKHDREGGSMTSLASMISERSSTAKPLAFDEDPDGHLVAKRVFIKLEIESPDHPFFKRVWLARHVLNQDSPLLTKEARKAVKLNGNCWPSELNFHEYVRASVQFDQILVSLSGTSNVDASSVYAQKVYSYDDVNVGYRFVNLLYHDKRDDRLSVDTSVLNDVCEQQGGGGEPFHECAHDNALAMLGTMMFL